MAKQRQSSITLFFSKSVAISACKRLRANSDDNSDQVEDQDDKDGKDSSDWDNAIILATDDADDPETSSTLTHSMDGSCSSECVKRSFMNHTILPISFQAKKKKAR